MEPESFSFLFPRNTSYANPKYIPNICHQRERLSPTKVCYTQGKVKSKSLESA